MIIQTILLDPSRAVWSDSASNVSRLDPSGAVQVDAEHPSRNRKVDGSNLTSRSKTAGQRVCPALLAGQVAAGGHSVGWITAPKAHPLRFAT
jgi:hypothetical protein